MAFFVAVAQQPSGLHHIIARFLPMEADMALSPLQRLPPRAGTVDQRPLPAKFLTVDVMPNDLQRRLVFQELLP